MRSLLCVKSLSVEGKIEMKKRFSTKDMCLCALFAALLAICAWISIPIPAINVNFTLQIFGIFLALLTLDGLRGTVTVVLYLLLGAVGLPVFSGFRGGISAFVMPSGGFLVGFVLTGLVYWAVTAVFGQGKWVRLAAAVAGLVPCYVLGVWWMYRFYDTPVPLSAKLLTALGFLGPDCVKILLAWLLSGKLRKFAA